MNKHRTFYRNYVCAVEAEVKTWGSCSKEILMKGAGAPTRNLLKGRLRRPRPDALRILKQKERSYE